MAEETKEQDPSIDEILASIRQIISDDEKSDGVRDDPAPEPDYSVPEPDEEDVIELTDRVEDDEDPEEPPIEVAMMDAPREEAPPPPPPPPPQPVPPPAPVMTQDLDTEILTQSAAAATLAGFTKLARDIQVSRSFEGVTLEDIVRAQLEPLLREWLDKNLPAMIERLVKEELERISKKVIE